MKILFFILFDEKYFSIYNLILLLEAKAVKKYDVLAKLKGGLIVSCQALETEALYDDKRSIMGFMARAAKWGGAVGIRANSVRDIKQIKEMVDLPIIGIIKSVTEGSDVYITPTIEEIKQLVEVSCDIIAIDATPRHRPDGVSLQDLMKKAREMFPDQLFMADCASLEECKMAEELGFDIVSTTLRGYTDYTRGAKIPDFSLISEIKKACKCFVIAEGGIWTPEDLAGALKAGADSAVVGTAITRPMEITKRFVDAIK